MTPDDGRRRRRHRTRRRPPAAADAVRHRGAGGARGRAGALWRLAEPGRQLDANVVRIPPGRRVDTHREPDLDVLLLVLAGEGSLTAPDGTQPLRAGTLIWLPHGSTRSLAADDEGLTYLTVHRRRPGLRIAPPGATGPSDGPPGSGDEVKPTPTK
ncbi:AraC family ligand binding domain-containing protein [Streptomyces sp. INA 01156]